MANAAAVLEALTGELRARKVTYAAVAKHLGMSEVSVKRMFSGGEVSLSRVDRICALIGLEFTDLARELSAQQPPVSQLTHEQEREFVNNPRLMLVALLVLARWSYDDIVATYKLEPAECVKLLVHLDKLKFIELMPNNRIRLLVSRAFAWIPGGPIERFFKQHALADYFGSHFEHPDELMVLANGSLSASSVQALIARLRKVAADFAEMRNDDASLPRNSRKAITMLVTARPWEPEFLARYRRQR